MKRKDAMRSQGVLLILAAFIVQAACAQPAVPGADPEPGEVAWASDTTWTETERTVQALLDEGGTVVVHFWAPWCHNSNNEYRSGFWPEVIDANEEVTFVFVTVFNHGELGERTLERHNIPERVVRLAQPDDGPSHIRSNRRRTFLDKPLIWTPTTWIFHDSRHAFALNYGEADAVLLQALFDNARADWSGH